ncbi:DUF4276 family protein [Pectobacterium polaris]|uniref:DUF4276 family protein n=1 Tax=Pectobacterium polaris TaxID=2042057 RepID=UPI0015819F53|nr:DUF3226 domain-containing protein [Pectobacterium polaris]MCU1795863.1 DUF4276 family protein [Pectobacterium polaris]
MHFNILVEGDSEVRFLKKVMPFLHGKLGVTHSWKIHKHQGVGSIPTNLNTTPNKKDNSLLHNLPAKLRAYENIANPLNRIIVLIDIDSNVKSTFLSQLNNIKTICAPTSDVRFVLACEELESWYLGDRNALVQYNPRINITTLNSYVQDSICGTWELLMRADDPSLLKPKTPYWKSLQKKIYWSKRITPYMNFRNNNSPSFNFLLRNLI